MKVDWYTKTVLTVIAVCLMILTLQQVNVVPRLHAAPFAASAPASATTSASGLDEIKVNYDGSINVRVTEVKTTPMGLPVNIQNGYIYTKAY